ncbi:E3 ubiquitin-protein ligase MBR2-like [Bidens hawaiensis]|uniref:E3 ubiquitin-protein ligase MBR2-like n=1 Tax=Bidens hawaiensis TaxID=980011 RepID=UPI00404AA313
MQGQKGIIGSSQEGLPLEHGSSSTDSGVVEPQFHWTNFIRTAPTNTTQETQNLSLWSMGESSSNHVSHRHEPPASMLSLGDANNGHNVTVNPSAFIGIKPANYASSSSSSSSLGPFEMEARQRPCKRKASELTIGQSSSGIINSNLFQTGSTGTNGQLSLISPDPTIPRLGPSVGAENNRRNVRIRINNSRQQEQLRVPASNSSNNNNRQLNFSSPYPSLGLNPVATTGDNSSSQVGQTMLRVPALRRNLHVTSRNRSSPSSLRANLPVSSNIISTPTNISDHPLFAPPHDMRNTAQLAVNWNLNPGGGNGNGPIANSGPRHGSSLSSSRRLSEALRWYTLSSNDSGAGGQNGNLLPRIPPPAVASASSSQESGIPSVIGVTSHHPQHRLPGSTDRLLDSAFGFPHLARTAAGASERRGWIASELRNVLDLIRRGENLRFEDVMGLDQSVFFGVAGIHDRHRDMRLDIDNMSYEELLALEERIGNVSTGLTEEKVLKCLKQKTFASVTGQPDAEPCCICQEEYVNGDDLGTLDCGHDFHTSCIKQWLLQKNSCPVCKSAASK